MTPPMHFSATFPARMSALSDAVVFLEQSALAAALPSAAALKLAFTLEELFTNTVQHGFGGDSEHPVTVVIQVSPTEVTLDYTDDAPPFNPIAQADTLSHGDLSVSLERRGIGGLGVFVSCQLANQTAYERRDGHNQTRFAFWLERARAT